MIASLRGNVARISGATIVVDVHGVGYLVHVSPRTLSALRLNSETFLHTALVVREDSQTLFGFSEYDELELFNVVQTVSGIGPKLALTMVAAMEPQTLLGHLAARNENALTTIPGVGKKSAARLILELSDKAATMASPSADTATDWRDDVVAALVSLGWSPKDSAAVVAALPEADINPADPGSALRLALQKLNRNR